MNRTNFDKLTLLKGYFTDLAFVTLGNATGLKFSDAWDRMLYCNVRGLQEECETLFNKIYNKCIEIDNKELLNDNS